MSEKHQIVPVWFFVGVLLLVIVTTVLSSLWPAIRSARIEPIQVLRED